MNTNSDAFTRVTGREADGSPTIQYLEQSAVAVGAGEGSGDPLREVLSPERARRHERLAIVLHLSEHPPVAAELKMTPQAIRSRASRALARVRAALGADVHVSDPTTRKSAS